MLILNTRELTNRRGIKHAYKFLRENGFSKHKIRLFHTGKCNNIKLKDLEKLCEIFNCTPNDIFNWKPDIESKLAANHQLHKLEKKTGVNLAEITTDMSNEEVEDFSKRIEALKNDMKK